MVDRFVSVDGSLLLPLAVRNKLIQGLVARADSPTIDLQRTGSGTVTDPYTFQAVLKDSGLADMFNSPLTKAALSDIGLDGGLVGVRLRNETAPAATNFPTGDTWRLLSWANEDFDRTPKDGSFHSTTVNPGRITIPKSMEGKLVTLSLKVQWPVNGTGGRYIEVRRNGDRWDGAQALSSSSSKPMVLRAGDSVIVSEGDYFEVYVAQTSGGDLAPSGSVTRLQLILAGTPVDDEAPTPEPEVPVVPPVTPPSGTELDFDSAFTTRANLSAFTGEGNMGFDRINLITDPGPRGSARKVAELDVRPEDVHSGYPRAQMVTRSFITSGEDYWIGSGWRVPDATRAITDSQNRKRLMLQEIYGSPFGKGGPNRLILNNGKFGIAAGPGYGYEDGLSPLWELAAPDDAWVDFAIHFSFSSTAGTADGQGFISLWYNLGAGWVNVNLGGSSPIVAGERRYAYVTRKPGTNDGGKNYFTAKVSYADAPSATVDGKKIAFGSMLPTVKMLFAGVKIGASLADVDMHSFAA